MISTLGVGQSTERFFTTYNGMLHPDAIMGGWERYQQKEINNDILVAFGYGDGGGGPTREMLENSQRMSQGIMGIPKVRQVCSRQYFEELYQKVKDDKNLPRWVGELYFEYHRGTYTSMARNKKANRKSELLLMDLEFLSLWGEKSCGIPYPSETIDSLWENVLLNQFHDILPGTSIKEVYDVTKTEYEAIATTGSALIHDVLSELASPGDCVTLVNTLGHTRDDFILWDVDPQEQIRALKNEDGQIFPVQKISDHQAISYVRGIPSKGCMSLIPETGSEIDSPFQISENLIDTPFYRVEFDRDATIISLYDKQEDREIIVQGSKGNLFRMYEDKPIYYDNWDIDIFYTEKYWDIHETVSQSWIENGPLRATLRIEKSFSQSVLKQDIHFYADNRRIDFVTWVDWKENQHLLKVLFPVDIHTDEASFDIQFGNVRRKTHKNTSWDMARFESCAQKWMDVSEASYGVALMNDCKYGHSVDDKTIALTLIKSGIEPNPTTDQEEHVFTYSLYPHCGTWREAGVALEANRLNQPMYVIRSQKIAPISWVSTDCDNVIVETVKKSYDGKGMILRIYENHGSRTGAKLRIGFPVKAVWDCDLLENKTTELPIESDATDSTRIALKIHPYEIRTLYVETQ